MPMAPNHHPTIPKRREPRSAVESGTPAALESFDAAESWVLLDRLRGSGSPRWGISSDVMTSASAAIVASLCDQ